MYKISVNNRYNFEVEQAGAELNVNGKLLKFDISQIAEGEVNILHEHKSFNVTLVELNRAEKTCMVKVNGNMYQLTVEDDYDKLLKQLGLDQHSAGKISEIRAPMPGLVLSVLTTENAEIKKGDNLLVLEAMKMENMLKSSADGQVKKILVKEGDKVEKNQVLIQF